MAGQPAAASTLLVSLALSLSAAQQTCAKLAVNLERRYSRTLGSDPTRNSPNGYDFFGFGEQISGDISYHGPIDAVAVCLAPRTEKQKYGAPYQAQTHSSVEAYAQLINLNQSQSLNRRIASLEAEGVHP